MFLFGKRYLFEVPFFCGQKQFHWTKQSSTEQLVTTAHFEKLDFSCPTKYTTEEPASRLGEEKHTSFQITHVATGPKQEPSPHILQEAEN